MKWKNFEHLLIVLGGVGGLETALQADTNLDAEDPKDLFDKYINTVHNRAPEQYELRRQYLYQCKPSDQNYQLKNLMILFF